MASYVYTARTVHGNAKPWGPSGGGIGVSVVHREDCPAIRHMERGRFAPVKSFPGPTHNPTRVRNLLNVKLCGRCKPDHDDVIAQAQR